MLSYIFKAFKIAFLSGLNLDILLEHVQNDNDLRAFAGTLGVISRSSDGYIKPGDYWLAESIASDLHNITSK